MTRFTTHSPEETERIGATLARGLGVGDVVAVRGELGTGKTVLIRGACEALGVRARVTSPTFTIGHRYPAKPDVAHLDLYRFESLSAAEWADIETLFVETIAFVEWPDVGREFLPAPCAVVTLSHVDEQRREIEVTDGSPSVQRALVDMDMDEDGASRA